MRRNKKLYQVVLTIESRFDVDDRFDVKERVMFSSKNRDTAWLWMLNHRELNTEMDSNDDGSSWCYIQTLHLVRVR